MLSDAKYQEAAQKAYQFIKRMLDPSAWQVHPYYGEHYDADYAYKLMWGGARDIPDDAQRVDPNYIQPEQYYYPGYHGVMRGIFRLPEGEDPGNYAVGLYRVGSSNRRVECFCPLLTEENDDGSISQIWESGKLKEAWEFYYKSYNMDVPYMEDGVGGFLPWATLEDGTEPEKYYKREFSTTKKVYWYWSDDDVGSSSTTYAYEIEFVRKDWNVRVTEEIKEEYFSDPPQRPAEGYVRSDYIGMLSKESYNIIDLIGAASISEVTGGMWLTKDDVQIPTPEGLPEYATRDEIDAIPEAKPEMESQSFTIQSPQEVHRGFIEYGYSRFLNYKIYLYALVLGDAEYLNADTTLWSDIIYDIPAVPPAIPPFIDEIKNVVVMLGESTSKRNFTFLSTVDTQDGANVYIPGYTRTTAENAGYISQKMGYATYKAAVNVPDEDFEYILNADGLETDVSTMKGRPETTGVFQFIAGADPQITNDQSIANWQTSLAKAFALYPDAKFIATMGDNVDNQVDMSIAEQQFDGFLSPPEMKTHPLLTVMGNHDDNMGFDGHFFAPKESSYGVDGGQGDYWTRYDNVLFMVLNTNAKDDRIQEHIDFINETVDYYVNANGKPAWTIVMFHHSIFQPTNTAEEEQYVRLRYAFGPCFSQNDIDLVLMGHVHSYCRTHVIDCSDLSVGEPVTETNIVPNSGGNEFTKTSDGQVLYITLNSSSGSKFYPLFGEHWYVARSNQELIPNISCVDVDEGRIVITTHRTSDMSVVDQFTLRK